jgi:hypothetical protein
MLIVDGTEAELVFEIGMNRYFANQYQGVDALVYLIMLRGALGIQEGLNPMILMDLLDAMVPEYLEVHMTNESLENEGIIKSDEFYRKRIEKMTGKDAPYIPDEKKKGSLSGQLEISFSQMEDLYVKRLLKEFDYCELAVFLKGSTGYIRKRVFENLSKKKANMIILEMEDKRSPSIREMEEVQNKVIKSTSLFHCPPGCSPATLRAYIGLPTSNEVLIVDLSSTPSNVSIVEFAASFGSQLAQPLGCKLCKAWF